MNVVNLSDKRSDKEWERILPILTEVEAAFALCESTPEAQAQAAAENDRIETQLSAIDCCTRAKLILLRALDNPEKGPLSQNELRLRKLLKSDRAMLAAQAKSAGNGSATCP